MFKWKSLLITIITGLLLTSNPASARFYSVDPVGFQENNSISFNRYGYANNNPFKFTDPNGEMPGYAFPSDYFPSGQVAKDFGTGFSNAAIGLAPGVGLYDGYTEIGNGMFIAGAVSIISELPTPAKGIRLFRGMKKTTENTPQVGPSARELGVRPNTDIPVDCNGCVHPSTGGLSVAPNKANNLPSFRRPAEYGGTGKDPVFSIKTNKLGDKLKYNQDKPSHGTIEPSESMTLDEFQDALSETASDWMGE